MDTPGTQPPFNDTVLNSQIFLYWLLVLMMNEDTHSLYKLLISFYISSENQQLSIKSNRFWLSGGGGGGGGGEKPPPPPPPPPPPAQELPVLTTLICTVLTAPMPSSIIHSSKYVQKLRGWWTIFLLLDIKWQRKVLLFFISIDILGFSEVQAESLTASLVDIITSSVHSVANSTVSKIDQVKKKKYLWA